MYTFPPTMSDPGMTRGLEDYFPLKLGTSQGRAVHFGAYS